MPMSMEADDRLSQAQQVRQSAFFMSREAMSGHDYNNPPPLAERFRVAEEIEEWLWKAGENRQLKELVRQFRKLITAYGDDLPSNDPEWEKKLLRDCARAIAPFE